MKSRDATGQAHPWTRLFRDPAGVGGLLIVAFFLLVAILVWSGLAGTGWSDVSPERFSGPGPEHWFGTNRLGQDIFERAVYGTGTAFQVGLLVAVVTTIIGALLGGLAGWFSHTVADEAVLWLKGVLDSIPFYLFVAAVVYALRGNNWSMHLAMIATLWTTTGRLVRGEVIRLKQREFIDAARAIGVPGLRILFRHVLPNTAHILLVQATLVFVAAIKAEVILSFLGMGIRDGVSWGLMLAESTEEVMSGQFANFIVASSCLFLLLMGFNVLSDALQDATNPKRERG